MDLLSTIHLDAKWMVYYKDMPARSQAPLTNNSPSDQKITVNLGCIDLGQIDLLVSEGFYSNRSECIRTAIREKLREHGDTVRAVTTRKSLVLGIHHFSLQDLLAVKARREKLQIRILGLASIANEVTPKLALDTIESIMVLGVLQASDEVRSALTTRIV
jgi:Arc/MetJ-type ribon-helix-helix transcriptional regulator